MCPDNNEVHVSSNAYNFLFELHKLAIIGKILLMIWVKNMLAQ